MRLCDNAALAAACRDATEGVIALYVISHKTFQAHRWSAWKMDFVLRQLRELSAELAKLNIPLKVLDVATFADTPAAIGEFCVQQQIDALYVNRQLLVDEMQRDQRVKQALAARGISFLSCDDATILPPEQLLKSDGTPFKVFTPFKRQWLKTVTMDCLQLVEKPRKQKVLSLSSDAIPASIKGFSVPKNPDLWPIGEKAVKQRLKKFSSQSVENYQQARDFPDQAATSRLSPYLANGIISVRQCMVALLTHFERHDFFDLLAFAGVECWISELIWREFYYGIAFHFPEVVKNKPFRAETDHLPWSYNKKHFQAWCDGQTGFPIVDAAMRQLQQTGWMHNRLRMVVAMFLSKTLFIDWRWGERYFMQQLIDGDFASNNGGWQWCASTGTDAVPYFRIFNPTTQSERFDRDGHFIRQYCPELIDCSAKEIHNPPLAYRKKVGYPEPIVDYSLMRKKVIAAFKALKGVSS